MDRLRRLLALLRVAFTLFLLMASMLLSLGLGWRSLVPKDVAGHDALASVYVHSRNAEVRRYAEDHIDDRKLTSDMRVAFDKAFWQTYVAHAADYRGRNVQADIFAMHTDDFVDFVAHRRRDRTGHYPAYVYDAFDRVKGRELVDLATAVAANDREDQELRRVAARYLVGQSVPPKTEEQILSARIVGQLLGKNGQ
ncbi:MAG: hypothetical protein JO197_10075 [Acidobacteria bacterium]|nr:hypothetical protein [Acidobacteriota bacterium]MBV9477440.1 hypothetical protein [Acidobacteriota bacterium]